MVTTNSDKVNERTGLIYDIRPGSLVDGPGVRVVVLFKGCSFSGCWCSNPELQSAATELLFDSSRCVRCGKCISTCANEAARVAGSAERGDQHIEVEREECTVCGACISGCEGGARALVGQRMSVEEALAQIEARLPAGGGVTMAGGEPFIQAGFLLDLLRACKTRGMHTAVDTFGYFPSQTLEIIRPWADLFLIELKFLDSARHEQFTGLPNQIILENIQALSAAGHPLVLRVPVIPGINDDEENHSAIAAFAARLPRLDAIELLPYRHPETDQYERLGIPNQSADIPEPQAETLSALSQLYLNHGLNARVNLARFGG